MNLMDFLIEHTGTELTEEVAVSERFKDKNGKLLKFKIRAMSNDEFSAMQKRNTKYDKKGRPSFDQRGAIMDVVLLCTVDPNFRSEEAVRKANVLSPEQLVNKLLLPGEVMELYRVISELSGFDKEPEELKDEVKN